MKNVRALFLALICSAWVFAETTGNLEVIVQDTNQAPLPGATVNVQKDGVNRSSTSDADGVSRVLLLPPALDYTVTVVMPGFGTVKREGIRVSIGQTFTVTVTMQPDLVEEMVITGDRPVVDQTTQVTGEFLELGLIEALPTSRSYQDYLQLVTGVLPSATENPAVKSGLNYRDALGEQGTSRDNFYYIDGVNTTDNITGTFGANFNSEIIAEQQVLTGGMPAEYEGAPGLLSNVVTKSGSNRYEGSINYYFQDSSLVGDTDEGIPSQTEYSTYDSAVVFSGPILKDRFYFLGSWQKRNTTSDINDANSGAFLREREFDADYKFLKLTFNPTASQTLDFIYGADPTDIGGDRNTNNVNNRDFTQVQGGDRYTLSYSALLGGNAVLEMKAAKIESEVSNYPRGDQSGVGPRNTVRFASGEVFTNADQQRGGYDFVSIDERNKDLIEAKLTYYLNTDNFGNHVLKFGAGYVRNTNIQDVSYPSGFRYESASVGAGVHTMADLVGLGIFVNSDFDRMADAINTQYSHLIPSLDLNGDGVIDRNEIRSAPSGFTTGNPHGQVNADRNVQVNAGVNNLESTGLHFFLQDQIEINRFSLNLGLRFEEFTHNASNGDEIYKFDWTVAPRIGVSYDVLGDGRHKAYGFYGRYYDPIRGNMTDFAGAFNGQTLEEQAFIGGEWVTYRVRGSAEEIDAIFAPTTKTPYTDETTLGYQIDLGQAMSLEFSATDRKTRNIMEDYDITPYSFVEDGQGYYSDPNIVGVYAIPLSYFGFTYEELLANPSNYVIATLLGGKRDYQGFDVTFRKSLANRWQMLASYAYNDFKGNTNSDSNADLQGDLEQLDPRVPGMYARQPGSVDHVAKLAGSYQLGRGFQVGGSYRWNSGLYYTRATSFASRNLPEGWDEVDVQDPNSGIADGIIGSEKTSAYGILDLRVAYNHTFANRYKFEAFVDIFNALDDQAVITENGRTDSNRAFGAATGWELPRRFYLGTRFSF
ncbi:MAG: TonB-dependent receptor [Acidobacteria bacterium]|nr:TonB-dependent receptor [Acidobacteriota bacterium]